MASILEEVGGGGSYNKAVEFPYVFFLLFCADKQPSVPSSS